MCGIFFAISGKENAKPSAELLEALQQRGPDATTIITRQETVPQSGVPAKQYFLTFASTVLSLRGDIIVKQPYFEEQNGSILCWNGEAWHLEGRQITGNDTKQIFRLLNRSDNDNSLEAIARRLALVSGPYAFIYYDASQQRIYLARDFLGRRSLLWRVDDNGDLLISSVSTGSNIEAWTEIDADGVYCIDLHHPGNEVYLGTYGLSRQSYLYRDSTSSPQSVIPQLLLNKACTITPKALQSDAPAVRALEYHLSNALRTRVQNIPPPPSSQYPSTNSARLAILFSGGLDCTVLARMSHDLLPQDEPIDLLNVAFENPRVHKNVQMSPYELCPDRITGRASFRELLEVCPKRLWRLIAVNVPYEETQAHRATVMSLMHPHNTEMDLSISYALYFASRGQGIASDARGTSFEYTTAARVLLSGLGADELFAGYTRHATAFQRHGFDGLFEELDLDIGRLGRRNLGRDDRVISHWSKEVRFPFLDEELVHWALHLPVTEKTGFGHEDSSTDASASLEPGKKVLRCLAWRLGMLNVAKEKKRAIQFGSRTAKMETGRTKGTTLLS